MRALPFTRRTASAPGRLDRVIASLADECRRRTWPVNVLRAGWLAKAFVYGLMGWVALLIALDRPTATDVSYTGAIEELARRPASRATLVLLAIGLFLYVTWRLLTALLVGGSTASCWAHRIGYLFSAATYTTIGWIAVQVAADRARPESESVVETVSRAMLGDPAGRTLLGLGGLTALGVAGYFFYKGLDRRFLEELDLDGVGTWERRLIVWTGVTGWLGRCLIVMVVGAFVTWSAIDADPVDARGLDRAIQRLANDGAGVAVVFAIAVLLIVYAVHCAASARYWKLEVDP